MNRYVFIFIGLAFIFIILRKVKGNLFSEEKSLFWILGGLGILILSIFPYLFVPISELLGIDHPPSLLFVLTSLFIIYKLFRQEQEISLLNEQVKELAQLNALLEEKIGQS
jgi:hypothetical protein